VVFNSLFLSAISGYFLVKVFRKQNSLLMKKLMQSLCKLWIDVVTAIHYLLKDKILLD